MISFPRKFTLKKRFFDWRAALAILALLVFAAAFRLPYLDSADIIDDEALIALRAAGWIDFAEIYTFQTPAYLLPSEQWWQKFSFADFPALGFGLMHTSIQFFGQNPWGIRLPSLVAGLISVFLVYRIGRRLNGTVFGFTAGFMLAAMNYHIWASRVGFMESLALLFILVAIDSFLSSFRQSWYWVAVGISMGSAIMVKQLAIVLVPLFFLLMLIYQRRAFRTPSLYVGILCGIVTLVPLIIYNYASYASLGYFDAVLGSVLGKVPEVYISTVGNRVGGLDIRRLVLFFDGYHWLEAFTAFAGLLFLLAISVREVLKRQRPKFFAMFLLTYFFVFLTLFLSIRGRKQYFVLMAPGVAWLSAFAWTYWHERIQNVFFKKTIIVFTVLCIAVSASVSINSQIVQNPFGPAHFAWLPVRTDSFRYAFLEQWLKDFYTTRHFRQKTYSNDRQIDIFQEKLLSRGLAKENSVVSEKELLVYDSTMDFSAVRWLFIRRKLYDVRPIMISERFVDRLQDIQFRQAVKGTFDFIYFVVLAPQRRGNGEFQWDRISADSAFLVRYIGSRSLAQAEEIKNPQGELLFLVYKISTKEFIDRLKI